MEYYKIQSKKSEDDFNHTFNTYIAGRLSDKYVQVHINVCTLKYYKKVNYFYSIDSGNYLTDIQLKNGKHIDKDEFLKAFSQCVANLKLFIDTN